MPLNSKIKSTLISLVTISFALVITHSALAKPLSKSQKKELSAQDEKQQGFLKKQMNQLIVSIADLDILTNRDEIADYEIFIEDADRILKAVGEIRAIDTSGVFKQMLDDLETPTLKLKELSLKKDKRAMLVPDQIFNACFRCHQTHRDI